MEKEYKEITYKVKAKSGKVYTYTKLRPKRELKGQIRISKSGRHYLCYYQKHQKDGLSPASQANKILCLKRDNYSCIACGSKENLDVHHRDGNSYRKVKNGANNNLDNLITLCHKCHLRLHLLNVRKRGNLVKYHQKYPTMSYAALGRVFKLSRERVRQILSTA